MSTQPATDPHTTVAIVGAGMAGLIAARALRRQGIDVLVLEAADRVGGRMMAQTSTLGSRLDLGGQWVGHGHHRFEALAAELGTTVFPMHTPKRPSIVHQGRAVSWIRPEVVIAGAALVAVEAASRLGAPRPWQALTVHEWLQKVPSRTARRLLEAVVEVSTTADLDRLSMGALLAMMREQGGLSTMLATKGGAQDSLVVEAAGTLPEKVAAELGESVLLDTEVTSIHRGDAGVTLRSASATIHAEKVIVCLPPPMRRTISFEPPLPPDLAGLPDDLYMGSVYKAIAVYEKPFWREFTDAECILLGRPAGAVFDSSPPDGPGHLCVLIGGKEARTLDAMTVVERQRTILASVADAVGSPAIREPVDWHEKSWHLDPFVKGGYLALPDAHLTVGVYPLPSNPVAATVFWAGTETAGEHPGYIEGAIESGERAAREVVASQRR